MDFLKALLLGAIIAIVLPMLLGGPNGVWLQSWAGWGTIRPLDGSPGLLLSIPVFAGATIIFWLFFNWHNR